MKKEETLKLVDDPQSVVSGKASIVLAGQESFRVKRRAVDKRKKANEVNKLI